MILTHQQVGAALGCSRQTAAKHIERGCPRESAEAALKWYHSNVRLRSDRKRPRVVTREPIGPNYNSRIFNLLHDHDAALELDADIRALPAAIAHDPGFFPAITNNQAVRRHVEALRSKWFN